MNPASSGPVSAIVSLWSDRTSTDEAHFLASGSFVGEKTILTVKHVFIDRNAEQVWVRVFGETQAYPVAGIDPHPKLDAALVRIAQMPALATSLAVDPGAQPNLHRQAHSVYGYFEGRPEWDVPLTVANYDPLAAKYITYPRHPQGHSGSAVCREGRLWAILVEHYVEPTADRGLALAVHQFWPDWLRDKMPVSSSLSPTAAPAASPSSAARLRGEHLSALRETLRLAFAKPSLQGHPAVPLSADGAPSAIDGLNIDDGPQLGRKLVAAVDRIAEVVARHFRDQSFPLAKAERRLLSDAFRKAMGHAARLCLDLDRCPGPDDVQKLLTVAAKTNEGAALAVRREPHNVWCPDPRNAIWLKDRHTLSAAIELGAGRDARNEFARLVIAAMPDSLGQAPAQVPEDRLLQLRGFLHNEADHGRTWFIMLRQEDLTRFSPEVQAEALHLGLGLIVVDTRDQSVFLYEEELLLGKVQGFLRQLEQEEWTA